MLSRKIIFVILAGVILLFPIFSFADDGAGFATRFPYWGTDPSILPCHGLDCRSACDVVLLFQRAFWFLLSLGVFAFAPLMIAVGGIMYMVGGSSTLVDGKQTASRGKSIITGTVIGIVFGLLAFIIVSVLIHVLGVQEYVGGFGNTVQCASYQTLTLPPLTSP